MLVKVGESEGGAHRVCLWTSRICEGAWQRRGKEMLCLENVSQLFAIPIQGIKAYDWG